MLYSKVFIIVAATTLISCGRDTAVESDGSARMLSLLSDTVDSKWATRLPEAPDQGCAPLYVKPIGYAKRVFDDIQDSQIVVASQVGIKPIITDIDIINLKRPIVKVQSCKEYFIENLTHSYPYLTVEAAQLLHDIGAEFNRRLAERGGGRYRIRVTSILRTPATVSKLRRVNRNATENSTHQYGTTFDISYSKFACDGTDATLRRFEDLKGLLAEVLNDLRDQGRCLIKYEVKQACFHITSTGK